MADARSNIELGSLEYEAELLTINSKLSLSYCSENSCLIVQQLQELYVKFVSKRHKKLDNAV